MNYFQNGNNHSPGRNKDQHDQQDQQTNRPTDQHKTPINARPPDDRRRVFLLLLFAFWGATNKFVILLGAAKNPHDFVGIYFFTTVFTTVTSEISALGGIKAIYPFFPPERLFLCGFPSMLTLSKHRLT